MHQSPFQRQLWLVARNAHAAGDRSDARIMLRMIEMIDEGDYGGLAPLAVALRSEYRAGLGPVPASRLVDGDTGAEQSQ